MLSTFIENHKSEFRLRLEIDKYDLDYIAFLLKHGVTEYERGLIIERCIELIPTLDTEKSKKLFCRKVKNLKDSQELQYYMATYDIEFAKYLLKYSHILSDIEIIKVINKYEQYSNVLQVMVATRKYIGEVLSDYVIAKNVKEAIYSLLRNPGAVVSGSSLCEIFMNNTDDMKLYEIVLLRLLKDPKNLKYLLVKSNEEIKARILDYVLNNNYTTQIYLPDDASYQAFDFFIHHDHMIKLKQDIDQLGRIKALSPLNIAKFIMQGDAYSFCYAISRLSDTSYTKVKTLFCSDYSSVVFADILTKAGFNYDLRTAIVQLIEFVYIAALEEYLTNENFLELVKKQYSFFVSKYRWDTYKTIEYLFGLAETNANQGLNG